MTTHRTPLLATAALGVALALTGCTAAPTPATAPTTSNAVVSPLVGEWTMTSLETGTDGNLVETPYDGQVIFTDAGTMAVQAANPDTTAPDTPLTVDGYEAYYGPVTIDDTAGTLSVTVASAAVRDNVGQTFTRNFEITGDTLVLTPTDPAEGFRVTYQRGN